MPEREDSENHRVPAAAVDISDAVLDTEERAEKPDPKTVTLVEPEKGEFSLSNALGTGRLIDNSPVRVPPSCAFTLRRRATAAPFQLQELAPRCGTFIVEEVSETHLEAPPVDPPPPIRRPGEKEQECPDAEETIVIETDAVGGKLSRAALEEEGLSIDTAPNKDPSSLCTEITTARDAPVDCDDFARTDDSDNHCLASKFVPPVRASTVLSAAPN